MSKALELAKKLLALSKSKDTGQESLMAQKVLEKHLAKTGITLEELEGDQVNWYTLKVPAREPFLRQLFIQIVAFVTQPDYYIYTIPKKKNRLNIIFQYRATVVQHIEILARYNLYRKHMAEEISAFYSAYVQAQSLGVESSEPVPYDPDNPALKYIPLISKKPFNKITKWLGFITQSVKFELYLPINLL